MNQSIERAFKIIEILAFQDSGELKIVEISKKTGLSSSTIYRFLKTLNRLNLVEKNSQNKKYRLTLELFKIGNNILINRNRNVLNYSIEKMKSLSKKYNETINLSTFEKNQVIYIYKITCTNSIKYEVTIGSEHPAYCTATGKIFLAYRNEEFIDSYLKINKLLKFTKNTVIDEDEIIKELKSVKLAGYALDKNEYIEGANCIAVPIIDINNHVNYALSISLPRVRLKYYKILNIIDDLIKSANDVSERIK